MYTSNVMTTCLKVNIRKNGKTLQLRNGTLILFLLYLKHEMVQALDYTSQALSIDMSHEWVLRKSFKGLSHAHVFYGNRIFPFQSILSSHIGAPYSSMGITKE